MGVNFNNNGKSLTALISGEIDHHTSFSIRAQIDERMSAEHPKTFILDFSGVTFMDTSGIGLILGRFKIARNLGAVMKVIHVPEKLKKIMILSGIKNMGILE